MRHISHYETQIPTDEMLWSLGCLMVRRAAGPELEVIEALAPAGVSPPLHRHDFGSETFYVLEGRIRFRVGDEEATYGPGGVAHVPRSVPHSFEVLEDARVLDLVAPAGLWAFFRECGEPAAAPRAPETVDIPADLAQIVARHRGAVLGPPLAQRGAAR